MFSSQELQQGQQQDPYIRKVLPFVLQRRRPSRRENHGADSKALRLFKQWDKLEVVDGILYRLTRDPITKLKRSQYVLHQALRDRAISHVCSCTPGKYQDIGPDAAGLYGFLVGLKTTNSDP